MTRTSSPVRRLALALLCCAAALALAALFATRPAGAQTADLIEGYEAGNKTAYAAGNVTLSSGSWYMDDALTGNLAADAKTGAYSARLRNVGRVRMNFNRVGAGSVTISHAKYGTDANSAWELWSSTNSGSTWTKVGATVTTASTSLQTVTFTVNTQASVRFEIRKTGGGTSRLNIDNVRITAYAATPTPTPTPTPSATPTPTPAPGPTPSTSVHLTLGNPSNAVADSVNYTTNYLMTKPQYALSYNRDNATPNWVAWHLDSSWLGSTARQNDFRNDTTLPTGWYQVLGTDYSGSGYDRGHMLPSADRTLTVTDNSSTFLMTNIIPQMQSNNQGPWADLETYCRTLAGTTNELYIVSGGVGTIGWIANGRVAVPRETWKVIVVIPKGTNDAARVTSATRTIAVVMPNSGTINTNWRTYRTSIDTVENITGYDFFANVEDAAEIAIEAVIDNQ